MSENTTTTGTATYAYRAADGYITGHTTVVAESVDDTIIKMLAKQAAEKSARDWQRSLFAHFCEDNF